MKRQEISLTDENTSSLGVVYSPAKVIGGDYYHLFESTKSNGIIVCDIAGKGSNSGLQVTTLAKLIKLTCSRTDEPRQIAKILNKLIYDAKEIPKQVSAFILTIDKHEPSLKYCSAGHDPVLHYSSNTFNSLNIGGVPLGMCENETYEDESKPFECDEMV